MEDVKKGILQSYLDSRGSGEGMWSSPEAKECLESQRSEAPTFSKRTFTIKQLAEKLKLDAAAAGVLIKIFVREGAAVALEPVKVEGQKGKAAVVYALRADLPARVAVALGCLVAEA